MKRLSPRHREICYLLYKGYAYKQIAHKFGTSENTVKNQIVELFDRFKVDSRWELQKKLYTAVTMGMTMKGVDFGEEKPEW